MIIHYYQFNSNKFVLLQHIKDVLSVFILDLSWENEHVRVSFGAAFHIVPIY